MKSLDQLLAELDEVRRHIMRAAGEIQSAEVASKDADEVFAREYALAYRRASGSVKDREMTAVVETELFRKEKDSKQIVLSYCKRRSVDLEAAQSNLQSQAKLLDLALRGGPR